MDKPCKKNGSFWLVLNSCLVFVYTLRKKKGRIFYLNTISFTSALMEEEIQFVLFLLNIVIYMTNLPNQVELDMI